MCLNETIFKTHGLKAVLTLITDESGNRDLTKAALSFRLALRLINHAGQNGIWDIDDLMECIEALRECKLLLVKADSLVILHPYFFKLSMLKDKLEVKLQRNNMAMVLVDTRCSRLPGEECINNYHCEACSKLEIVSS